jgi:hypothetical protein
VGERGVRGVRGSDMVDFLLRRAVRVM